jgi:very-short-patch-repair endonuclease
MPAKKRRPRAKPVRRVVLVRGPRLPAPRDPATGRWVSVPEDILWAAYLDTAKRWPALAGMARQVPAAGYYLDFGIARRRLGIEVDGLAFHGGQEAWAKDHQRQRKIEAAGWRITRYTAREAAEHPLAVLNEINQLWAVRR